MSKRQGENIAFIYFLTVNVDQKKWFLLHHFIKIVYTCSVQKKTVIPFGASCDINRSFKLSYWGWLLCHQSLQGNYLHCMCRFVYIILYQIIWLSVVHFITYSDLLSISRYIHYFRKYAYYFITILHVIIH